MGRGLLVALTGEGGPYAPHGPALRRVL